MTQQELADDAYVDIKTVYNLESGTRWPIAKNRAALAVALRWEPDALAVIAAGREPAAAALAEATPSPASPEGRRTAARLPGLHRNGDLFPGLSPQLAVEVEPHFREIEARIRVAEAARPEQVLTGGMVFPDSTLDAARWDGLAARGYSVWQLAQALAVIHVLDPAVQAEPRDETASGLTAEEAS